jgi:Tfp pilus assembly protein PilO
MDKQLLLRKILHKKEIRDYTYATLFLFISSFFIFFAIKPALSIAFSLKQEFYQLHRLNEDYEKNILKIVALQSQLENVRGETYLLDEVLPSKPQMKNLVDEIKKIASSEGIAIKNLSLSKIDLKKITEENKISSLKMNMEIETDFPVMRNFTQKIIDQRRLMTVNKLRIFKKDIFSTESGQLTVEMEIGGFYL